MFESYQTIEECLNEARITDDLSNSSIKKYLSSIKKFFDIVGQKVLEDLTIEDFNKFILKMKEMGAGNARIANVISAMKWVMKRLQDSGKISRQLDLVKIKKPKIMRKEVSYLTEEEIKTFICCIEDLIQNKPAIINVRFMALIMLLAQTGCRIGEALSINKDYIDWQNKEVPIIGKGNKPRTLFLTENTVYWLKRYLSMRNDEHKALFVIQNGDDRWKQTDVGRSFRKFRKLSCIKKDFTPHTLRHTFATQYITKGASLNVVQAALGHSDAITTLKYYVGAVNRQKVREMINDRHFDFIPTGSLIVE